MTQKHSIHSSTQVPRIHHTLGNIKAKLNPNILISDGTCDPLKFET